MAAPAAAPPFLVLTLLIAALPLLAYLLFGRRAREAMSRVRDFMTEEAWLVNIAVLGLFIVLIPGLVLIPVAEEDERVVEEQRQCGERAGDVGQRRGVQHPLHPGALARADDAELSELARGAP
jgi:hypothetical protein